MAEPHAPARHVVQERVLFALFLGLLWLTRYAPSEHPAVPELDPSWAQALGYALTRGLQFGVDVVFTYGPLGWFAHAAWQPELFGWKLLAFELAFKLALCAVLARGIARVDGPASKLTFALLLLVPEPGAEAFYFTCVVALGAWLLERTRAADSNRASARELLATAPVWLLLAGVAWIKFTYLVLAVAAIAVVVARLVLAKRARAAGAHALVAFGALLFLWCACGQNPLNLWAYVSTSWEVARGYAQAMSAPAESTDVALAVASLAGGLFLVWGSARDAGARVLAPRLALFAAGAFVAFKAGFVAAGSTTLTCFGYALWTPWWFANDAVAAPRRAGALALGRVLVALLALWGYQRAQLASGVGTTRPLAAWNQILADHANSIAELDTLREAYTLERAALAAQHALPRVRERVGDAEIDVFQVELAVLFLNDLRWRPRPVIQSYAAYTERLAELNAAHFRSERAPRFVLWRFTTIDHRLPGLDDAPAQCEVLRRYRPVLSEGGYLLLERDDARGAAPAARRVLERDVRFGERVELPELDGRGGVLRLDLRPTARGALEGFLASWPRVELEIETDGAFTSTFRIVPGAARAGVLIDPWMCGQDAVENACSGGKSQRVTAIRVVSSEAAERAFAPEIGLVYEHHAGLVPPFDPEKARALAYSMLDRAPVSTREPIPFSRSSIEGRSVLVVHAPSELVYELEPGRWRVDARFGMLPPSDETICTDGAVFAFVLRNERGDAAFWRQALDPRARTADRGLQHVTHEFSLPESTRFVLRTNVGPRGDGACDWCYWTDVRFVRVDAEEPK
ncbi:MAG: hypothetical protein IPJ77_06695 [Planctomycetes bacterium]|nr:hypothetical protein [Planctomycetota bacterium]